MQVNLSLSLSLSSSSSSLSPIPFCSFKIFLSLLLQLSIHLVFLLFVSPNSYFSTSLSPWFIIFDFFFACFLSFFLLLIRATGKDFSWPMFSCSQLANATDDTVLNPETSKSTQPYVNNTVISDRKYVTN